MKALLLAAGYGTRLRPITNKIPKCLVPIHNKPLLQYWLELLVPNGVNRILINTHYLENKVHAFIQSSQYVNNVDLIHESELLGTAGTVKANGQYFKNESFIVAHADNLTRFDPQEFISRHNNRSKNVVITMMTFETDTPQSCGIVELSNEGIVIDFHEKEQNPPSCLASAAVYIFEPEVLDFISTLTIKNPDISQDVIPHFLGRIQTFHNADYHRDIGSLESLNKAELEF